MARYWLPLVALSVGLAAYGGMVSLQLQAGTLVGGSTPYTLAWYALAAAAYLGTVLWAEGNGGLPLSFIWIGAAAFRILLLFTTPTLSSDVYRYMWDGYVTNNGVSPYAYPIESPAFDYLDTPQRALANHTWMASPYLPAAQYLFAALTLITPARPLVFQVVMALLDLGNGFLLVRLLRLAGLPEHRVLLYLWNPLVVVEIAHGAHVDSWMLFLTGLALWLTEREKQKPVFSPQDLLGKKTGFLVMEFLGPILLALATLTKGLPALLLVVLFWGWSRRQLLLYGLVVAGLLLQAGLAAGWGLSGPLDGTGLFGALRIYADKWNFNSGLFHWVEKALTEEGLDLAAANRWAKRLMGGAMALALAGIWLKARADGATRARLRLMALPFMAYLLLTTTVHPWYLLILLFFLPFLPPAPGESRRRWLAAAPWLYLSLALALSYLTYLDLANLREYEWIRKTEWWPAWGLFLLWLIARGES